MFDSLKTDRSITLILVGILSLAFGLRLINIAAPSLWLDEAITANNCIDSMKSAIQFAKGDVHPPLYYMILNKWSVFGRDEFTLRFFSLIVNVLTGGILYRLCCSMFDKSVALISLVIFSISPFQVHYSQEVRMYALIGLWMILALYYTWQYLQEGKGSFLFGYVLFASLGIYTHYQSFVYLVSINIVVITRLYRKERHLLWPWISAQVVLVIIYTPWIPVFINQLKAGGRSWITFNPSISLFLSPLFAFIWDEPVSSAYLWQYPYLRNIVIMSSVISVIILLTSAFIYRINNLQTRALWFLIVIFICNISLSYLISFKTNVYGTKYLYGASLISYIIFANIIMTLFRWNRKAGYILFGLLLLSQLLILNIYNFTDNRENWRGAVTFIQNNPRTGQAVGFHNSSPMAPFVYYSRNSLTAFGLLQDGKLSPSVPNIMNSHRSIWVFDYLAQLYDPKGMVKLKLSENGYLPIWHHDFNGVPLTLWEKPAYVINRLPV